MATLDTPLLLEAQGCACFNLRKATRAVTQLYDDALRPAGLRCTQFSLLTLLKASGTVAMTRLAEAAVMDRTTLARNLEVLDREGLVRIRPGEDARVREIELTRAGVAKLKEAFPLWREAQRTVREGLGPGRLSRLLADLSLAVDAAGGHPERSAGHPERSEGSARA
jgi:DNA-binding MarR family transcriptional regulator